MIKIISEEKVSFSSRLNKLIDEKNNSDDRQDRITNISLAEQLETSPQTISSWRNGKVPNRANKRYSCENIYVKLAEIFDVDPEYLKCTQIERKEKKVVRKKRTQHRSGSIADKWNAKISPEEVERIGRELQESKEKGKLIDRAIQFCSSFDIIIEPEIIDTHEIQYTYQILRDNTIYTVQENVDVTKNSGDFTVILPDGSERTKSEDQIIDFYNSMKEYCITQLKI